MLEYQACGSDIGDAELVEIADLLTLCFGRPPGADFAERVREKPNLHGQLARANGTLVGYKLGYERSRGVFYSWLGGVHPDHRRKGIARTLMQRQHATCREAGYKAVLTETKKPWSGMLVLNLLEGFDVVGTHLNDRGDLMVMLCKVLRADETSGPNE